MKQALPQVKTATYRLLNDGTFVIENYNFAKPFSSFFPGIAGVYGIPMWVFFVNRGQGICSFGTHSKDQPILEFLPANKAYQMVFERGFRTFIKMSDRSQYIVYEPFQDSLQNAPFSRQNRLCITAGELSLIEENKTLGLKTQVDYFTIPNDVFAALSRTVTITNTTRAAKQIEVLDGAPFVIPYGVGNMFIKKLARTIEAWMGVENLNRRAPFYRLKIDPIDRPEVIPIYKGNFYCAFTQSGKTSTLLTPIVDPTCIFGLPNNLSVPYEFLKSKKFVLPKSQIVLSKTPCAFSCVNTTLKPGKQLVIYSMFGMMEHVKKLNRNIARITSRDYIEAKRAESPTVLEPVMSCLAMSSAQRTLDQYARRTFLDNVLRGGLPVTLDEKRREVIYVYARKHGDLERDYNKFETQPTYFSQGNGNYRDINQNRRNDIFFNPQLGDANIISFFNFIQLDGFNPLVIKGLRYHIDDAEKIQSLIATHVTKSANHKLAQFFASPFHIGRLFMFLEEHAIELRDRDAFIRDVIDVSIKQEKAEHKEGFWSDHWTYNLDLLESYLSVFPEKLREILIDKKEFNFYEDYYIVNPRHKKYLLYDGKPRQLNSLVWCQERADLIKSRAVKPHTVRTRYGTGDIYWTNLLEKCMCIICNKLASLDPSGVGIEMEANKPNWYDALNGLPGLFGSAISETMELKRWIRFLVDALHQLHISDDFAIPMAQEIVEFYEALGRVLGQARSGELDMFGFWDRAASAKEHFRERTCLGLDGAQQTIKAADLFKFLERALEKVTSAIAAAYDKKTATYATYFLHEIVEYERIDGDGSNEYIRPLRFRQKPLALFLEGFVHAFKIIDSYNEKHKLYRAVRQSPLYDKALGMYKVNASLAQEPPEIGRTHVFTPGWLENESVWLHMEYKYLLEVLRAGLHDEFYDDFFRALIPFRNPQQYGRSILENSSFIVSSVFPDKTLHGNGFVARLSGSTSEFIHMWVYMNFGAKPFCVDDAGNLILQLRPVLSKKLFTTKKQAMIFWQHDQKHSVNIPKNAYACMFLKNILVVYHNPKRRDTFGSQGVAIKHIILTDAQGKTVTGDGPVIRDPYAQQVRAGEYVRIDVHLA